MNDAELKIDFDTLAEGEFSRVALAATADLKAHPERQALANLFNMLALIGFLIGLGLLLCLPSLVNHIWHSGV